MFISGRKKIWKIIAAGKWQMYRSSAIIVVNRCPICVKWYNGYNGYINYVIEIYRSKNGSMFGSSQVFSKCCTALYLIARYFHRKDPNETGVDNIYNER